MIVLLHPRAASKRSRRFPLSVLAIAAVLEGREKYAIVDGNVDPNPAESLDKIQRETPIEVLGVSVMPGPQMTNAIALCSCFRDKYPSIPIVWGGYFPSLYTDAALNARYVDYAVRSQGEDTFAELIAAVRDGGDVSLIRGLSFKDPSGQHVHNLSRPLRSPEEYPWFPYHRVDAAKYILPTFLGSRTAAHHASMGCPFRCSFCGVAPLFDGEKMESPERTAAVLRFLASQYGVNAIQFYDSNFFLGEDHARELAACLIPLRLRWWCQGRIATLLEYSDETLRALRQAGAVMIYCGAESGSNWALEQMGKKLRVEQTVAFAERIRDFGIIPEFSFVVGNPQDPARDTNECIEFIRTLKRINPDAEIIIQHYIPTPQRGSMYGEVDGKITFPVTPEEWAQDRWHRFTMREEPRVPWLPATLKQRIDNFETVINARWPTVQDVSLPLWGRTLLKSLSAWRYRTGFYSYPLELAWMQKAVHLRKPKEQGL